MTITRIIWVKNAFKLMPHQESFHIKNEYDILEQNIQHLTYTLTLKKKPKTILFVLKNLHKVAVILQDLPFYLSYYC